MNEIVSNFEPIRAGSGLDLIRGWDLIIDLAFSVLVEVPDCPSISNIVLVKLV